MATKITFKMSPNAMAVCESIADQASYRAAQKLRGRAMSNIRSLGRIDTGKMINLLQVRIPEPRGKAGYAVGSTASYAPFQEFGTRAHGPVRAQFMVFKPKGSGKLVFAKWVRGVTPGLFMTRAMQAASAGDYT